MDLSGSGTTSKVYAKRHIKGTRTRSIVLVGPLVFVDKMHL